VVTLRKGFTIVEVLMGLLIALEVVIISLAGIPVVLRASENVRKNVAITNVLDSLVSMSKMVQISSVRDILEDDSVREALSILKEQADGFDLNVDVREERFDHPLFHGTYLVTIIATMDFHEGNSRIIKLHVVRRGE